MSQTTARPPTAVPPSGDNSFVHVVFIAGAAALGGFLFGYDSSVINGAVTGIQKHFNVGSNTTGTVVASALLGSAVGAWFAGGMADRFGRIRVMQLAAILFAASAIGSALSVNEWELLGWRVVGGLAIGIASVIAPAYIAEVAPPAYRGRLASLQQMAIVLGICISQLVNYAIAQGAGGKAENKLGAMDAWRWMLLAAIVPAVIYGVLASLIPESPRYLIAAGREDKARQVLAEVEGEHTDLDLRIGEIRTAIATEHRPRLGDLRGRWGLMPIVWIGIGVSVLQQLVGINVIFYYSSLLWQSVGINESNSLLISLSTSIVNIIGTLIAIALVDRIGRKPLLLIGSAGMAVTLGVAAWAFSYASGGGKNVKIPGTEGTAALVAAHVYVLFFALSWGVVVWVLLGEMFPNKVRTIALSVAAAAQWLANWAVTETFPSLSRWNLSNTYIMYACFAAISIPFVWFLVHETKGRTLESMNSED